MSRCAPAMKPAGRIFKESAADTGLGALIALIACAANRIFGTVHAVFRNPDIPALCPTSLHGKTDQRTGPSSRADESDETDLPAVGILPRVDRPAVGKKAGWIGVGIKAQPVDISDTSSGEP